MSNIATGGLTPILVENTGDIEDASIPSLAYTNNRSRWQKHRDVFQGTEAIRNGTTDYLPQYEGESDERYATRLNRAAFYNGYARTVLASVGLILAEDPTFEDDTAQPIQDWWENADGSGTHGSVLTKRLLLNAIIDSFGGLLVEHTRADSPKLNRENASAAAKPGATLSGDDEARLGLRPYLLHFKADDIVKEYYETINGVRVLCLLILREVIKERVGSFGLATVVQFRVYSNEKGSITYRLYKSPIGTQGKPLLVEGPIAITNQSEIPWSPLLLGDDIPGRPGEYKAPLSDLADLNLQYHVSLTDHLSLQSLAYVPTPVRIGAPGVADPSSGVLTYPPLILGPGNTIEAPLQDNGPPQPVYWLSPPVDVLTEGAATLTQTKADMATLGAAFLSAETRAAETAEGKRIDSAASRATLTNMSKALKDCLERAVAYEGRFANLPVGSIALAEEFDGNGLDVAYMTIVLTAYTAGVISMEDMRYVLQTGQLPEDFDNTDVMDLLLTQEAKLANEAALATAAGQPAKTVPPAPRPTKKVPVKKPVKKTKKPKAAV